MTTTTKALLILSGLLLLASIFLPIWRIELDAPQYPEGLVMLIYANKLGGDVEIINGLNHYIGMATLHAENFIEFTILPYIIGFFAVWALLTALINRVKLLYGLLGSFILFGIVAMVDFWRWEYNYGHNLDPNAAIIVPGMAYQPPLIGFKQLLNFGAYSIPDIGGILFIASGLLMVGAVVKEKGWLTRLKRKPTLHSVLVILVLMSITSCGHNGPENIQLNQDNCDFCKMTIVDGHFGSEVVTKKGRVYKFDDLSCLVGYAKENPKAELSGYYIHNYPSENELIDATKAVFIASDSLRSPMGGNIAAFKNMSEAENFAKNLNSSIKSWDQVKPQ